MSQPGEPDTIPWDQMTPEQKSKCTLDHLAHEWASGNLRPISEQLARARKNAPTPDQAGGDPGGGGAMKAIRQTPDLDQLGRDLPGGGH